MKSSHAANWKHFKELPQDRQMALVFSTEDEPLPAVQQAGVLPLTESQLGYIDHSAVIAAYVADVGKESAKQDETANQMLRQLLSELYNEGEIPEEALDGVSFEAVLEDPSSFLLPPIYTQKAEDIESYFRTMKAIETMA